MTSVQNVNNNTTVNTSAGVGAGAAVGTGLGYLLARKPSEDAFVKAGLKYLENETDESIKFLAKALKQIKKDGIDKLPEEMKKGLSELLGDKELNFENTKELFSLFVNEKQNLNKGTVYKKALEKIKDSTHKNAAAAIEKLKGKIANCESEFADWVAAFKDDFANKTDDYKEVVKSMKKGAMIKYAAIGAIVLGGLGFILANKAKDKKAA